MGHPTSLGDPLSSAFPSGNGVAGGQFLFSFTILPGDANRDNQVTGADYTIWADHFGASGAAFTHGDFTGDGHVTGADYTVWADHYNLAWTAPPVDLGPQQDRRADQADSAALAPLAALSARSEAPTFGAGGSASAVGAASRSAARRGGLAAVDALFAEVDWREEVDTPWNELRMLLPQRRTG